MRNIILHQHFFKNAGTSFDALLKSNFPGKWVTREFTNTRNPEHANEIIQWIRDEPNAVAFSSHTMEGPLPVIPGINVIPCFFLRHPLLRVRSVYEFERKQDAGIDPGPLFAKENGFKDYVRWRLDRKGDETFRNLHCSRVRRWGSETLDQLSASKEILNSIAFFGVVERFDDSVELLSKAIEPYFPEFRAESFHLNVASHNQGNQLSSIAADLGRELYDELVDINRNDLELYELAVGLIKIRYKNLYREGKESNHCDS